MLTKLKTAFSVITLLLLIYLIGSTTFQVNRDRFYVVVGRYTTTSVSDDWAKFFITLRNENALSIAISVISDGEGEVVCAAALFDQYGTARSHGHPIQKFLNRIRYSSNIQGLLRYQSFQLPNGQVVTDLSFTAMHRAELVHESLSLDGRTAHCVQRV